MTQVHPSQMLNEEELLQSLRAPSSKSRIRYSRKQLLELTEDPICKSKPEELKSMEILVESGSSYRYLSMASILDRNQDINHSKYFDRYASTKSRGSKKPASFFNGGARDGREERRDSSTWSGKPVGKEDRPIRKRIDEKSSSSTTAVPRKPRQAAWYDEKILPTSAALESLEPNPEELTQNEMDRRNAFEEFRKQMGKASEEDASNASGLPGFFSDAPMINDELLESAPSTNNNATSSSSSFLGFSSTDTDGALELDSLLNIGLGGEDNDDGFSFPLIRTKQENRGRSKFFSEHNHQQQIPNENAQQRSVDHQFKSEKEIFDEGMLMKGMLGSDFDDSKSNVDPLQAIFANSSAHPPANNRSHPTMNAPPYPYSNNANNNVPLEMTDVSSIEQELLKGRGAESVQTDPRNANPNHFVDLFSKFQGPPQPKMPMRNVSAPPTMGPQSQYINPYEQYMKTQFLKQQQQMHMQQQQQQPPQAQLEAEKDSPAKQKSPASATKKNRNQFVPPQISKSIGKAIKPKKQGKKASEQVVQEAPPQHPAQQYPPQNIAAKGPPMQGGIPQPMSPMNPNFMMQPMRMPPMYNSGGFPQQWFNYVGQQPGLVPNGMMSLPSDALSVEDLERNFMQSARNQ